MSSDASGTPASAGHSGSQLIALDLGTTFVKGAVLDLDRLRIRDVRRFPFPEPLPGLPPQFCEIDPDAIVGAARRLITDLLSAAPDCAGLVMCSQMQGLVLTDATGQPISNCITWRDQRALDRLPSGNGTYFAELSQRLSARQRGSLGELHAGLPFCTLFWLAEHGSLPEGATPASLPDYVLASLCEGPTEPGVEATNASVHGPLDLATRTWQEDILANLGLAEVRWPRVRRAGEIVGHLRCADRTLPCFTPVGDQPCSLAGALLREGELSLNISTGSQASIISPTLVRGDYQTRPFFDGKYLNLITHIPAGRALSALVGLLSELAEAEGVTLRDPWGAIAQAVEQTASTDLEVNLAFFASLRGDRGAITNIREENLSIGHLFRAAFEDMADNYHACALRLAPDRSWERLVFSGGLAVKIEPLRQIICDRFRVEHRLSPSPEDALQGLMALALAFTGRAASVTEAIEWLRNGARQAGGTHGNTGKEPRWTRFAGE